MSISAAEDVFENTAKSTSSYQSKLPSKPVAIGGMSREELDAELKKGIESLKSGSYTADEVDEILDKEFGI